MDRVVGFIGDVFDRLMQRETLIVIVALYLVHTGQVDSLEKAAVVATSVITLVGGRSIVKASAGVA